MDFSKIDSEEYHSLFRKSITGKEVAVEVAKLDKVAAETGIRIRGYYLVSDKNCQMNIEITDPHGNPFLILRKNWWEASFNATICVSPEERKELGK